MWLYGMEVPKGGLEPPCLVRHNALNVACLPISPLRLGCPPWTSIILPYLLRLVKCFLDTIAYSNRNIYTTSSISILFYPITRRNHEPARALPKASSVVILAF